VSIDWHDILLIILTLVTISRAAWPKTTMNQGWL